MVKAGPLEAILIVLSCRFLLFLFESSRKNMKYDTTFVRVRNGGHYGDAKMSKNGTSLRQI